MQYSIRHRGKERKESEKFLVTVHFPFIPHYIQWHSLPLNSLMYFWSLLITTLPHHHHTYTFGFVPH